MKFLGIEISKKLLIGIIAGVVIVGGGITTGVILMNNKDKQPQQEEQAKDVLLKDNLTFEINSEVNLLSLISEDNQATIINKDEKIDTTTLGKKEVTIKYDNGLLNQTLEKKIRINVVDTQKPTIEYQKELSTNVGTKIDLLKDVKAIDNSKEEIEVTIEGEYDFNKEGTYNLKYIAVDSSNNKTEEEFILKVNKKATLSNTSKPSVSQPIEPAIDDEVKACPAEKGKVTYSQVFTDKNKAYAWNVGYDCEHMRLMEFILAYDPNIKEMRTLEWVYPSMYDNWDPNFQKDGPERQQMDKWLKTYHPELLQKTYTYEEIEAQLRKQGLVNDNTISISGDYWSSMKLGSETHYYFWTVQG